MRPRPDSTPPRTVLEEELAADLGPGFASGEDRRANFLDLGGDSVLAAQVVAQMADKLGVQCSLLQFFEKPTLAGVAEQISKIRLNFTDEMAHDLPAMRKSFGSGNPKTSGSRTPAMIGV